MNANLTNCYDCPVTLLSIIGLAGVLALACQLMTVRFAPLRALGAIVGVVGFLCLLAMTFKVPQWGIVNPFVREFALFKRSTDFAIFFMLDAAFFAVLIWSLRSYARRVRNTKLALEAAKLDRQEERDLANEVYAGEADWPEY
jgi:hypothetical protein